MDKSRYKKDLDEQYFMQEKRKMVEAVNKYQDDLQKKAIAKEHKK